MGEHLNQYLSKSQCYCLNEDATLNLANLLMGTGTGLKSNADEQLLIHLAMNQTVKVSNIRLTLPEDETCPHTVKIYANKSSLGFDEALDLKPTQEAKLTQGVAIQTINLLAAKFQRVESITLFIVDNNGAEVSVINRIDLFGTAISGTDVSKIKSC